jgi:gliding motility-associated-like protein
LKITDAFPQIERMMCKVRVSQQPFFTGTGPVEDSICLNSETQLLGGVTPTDTVGVNIPVGSFELGGSFAGLTYLPDGSGAQYTAPIDISGFPIGSTITNSQDLNQVCITMEHSFLGDLELALECPNGTQVTLMNSYNPGFIAGGTSGGGTYMGDPIDDIGGGGPGEGWEYCFSSVFNTWGDYPTEFGNGNTIPAPNFGNGGASMNPNGVYLPETDFAAFAGCPINGQWTIIVQDNLGTDDGYIFEWGLFFDPSFFGDLGSYQNTVVHDFWSENDAIISQVDTITGQTDTLLTVRPDAPGDYEFTYNVVDDFGCHYDTTVTVFVIDVPTIFNDTSVCDYNFQITGTDSYNGGVWSVDTTVISLTDSLIPNPGVYADTGGVYYFIYTSNRCSFKDTATINFIVTPYGYIVGDEEFCEGSDLTLAGFHPEGYAEEYLWSTGSTSQDIVITEPGQYWVQFNNECGTHTDTVNVTTKICDIKPPNVITPNGDGVNDLWFVKSEGMKEFYCEIRNRWGNVVYSYTDVSGGWDGKSKSGQTVSPGVYFYYIQALSEGDQEIVQQGAITVKQ